MYKGGVALTVPFALAATQYAPVVPLLYTKAVTVGSDLNATG